MKSLQESSKGYLEELSKRGKKSGIHRSFQAIGYEIAVILEDLPHKSLYIKLAKTMDGQHLLGIAKDVASRTTIENKGAYFMKIVYSKDNEPLTNPHEHRYYKK